MSVERVLLLGATGMLGTSLAGMLSRDFRVFAARPRNSRVPQEQHKVTWLPISVDAANLNDLDKLVLKSSPDAIVNCIAVTPDKGCLDDHVSCIAVNGLFPHRLANACRKYGCHLVHIGTDGVFSGRRGNYSEADLPDPPDFYGRAKLAGEVSDTGCVTIRTTFFGPSVARRGLVEWLLTKRGGRIPGYTRYIFSGLSTTELSAAIVALLSQPTLLNGIYHVGGPAMSKYNLLVALSQRLNLGIAIDPVADPSIDRSLNSARFWAAIRVTPPSVEKMVEDVYLELKAAKR